MTTNTREVTAKLTVRSSEKVDDQASIALFANYDDPRNKAWAPYTPAANLQMVVTPGVAEEYFPVGRNFLVTFTPED